VHEADLPDVRGAKRVLPQMVETCPRLEVIYADGAYQGPKLAQWVTECGGGRMEIVEKPADQQGFSVLPKRWVVERTFAWLIRHRRLARDYETDPSSSEAWIRLAMIRLMLARLANES
jgi:putative transposase